MWGLGLAVGERVCPSGTMLAIKQRLTKRLMDERRPPRSQRSMLRPKQCHCTCVESDLTHCSTTSTQ